VPNVDTVLLDSNVPVGLAEFDEAWMEHAPLPMPESADIDDYWEKQKSSPIKRARTWVGKFCKTATTALATGLLSIAGTVQLANEFLDPFSYRHYGLDYQGGVYDRAHPTAGPGAHKRIGGVVIGGINERLPFGEADAALEELRAYKVLDADSPVAALDPPAGAMDIEHERQKLVQFYKDNQLDRLIVMGVSLGGLMAKDLITGTDIVVDKYVVFESPSNKWTAFRGGQVGPVASLDEINFKGDFLTRVMATMLGQVIDKKIVDKTELIRSSILETLNNASHQMFFSQLVYLDQADISANVDALKYNFTPKSEIVYVRPEQAWTDPTVDVQNAAPDYNTGFAKQLGVKFTDLKVPVKGHANVVDAMPYVARYFYAQKYGVDHEYAESILNGPGYKRMPKLEYDSTADDMFPLVRHV
jgi:hypothetical protein